MFIVLGMFLFLIIFVVLGGTNDRYEIKVPKYDYWWQSKSSAMFLSSEDKIILNYYTEEGFVNLCMNYLVNCRRQPRLYDTVQALNTYINTGKWK